MKFITEQLLFYSALVLVLFLPGWFFLNLIETKKKYFLLLEKFVISTGLSIVLANFLLIIVGKLGIPINRASVILSIIILISLLLTTGYLTKKLGNTYLRPELSVTNKNNNLDFSKNQIILIVLILFLTIFIKTIYLKDTIFPTATDLGHHMYWSKLIATSGNLPIYQEQDIIKIEKTHQFSPPQKIADFIIGEHLIFAAINLISGLDFISYFPSLTLFLIHLLAIFAIFILTLRLFGKTISKNNNINTAILALFFIGPLYAISSSQTKFVSGGVVGNTLGNLLIPLGLYFLVRALEEKSPVFMALTTLNVIGLAYVHHLSTLVFIFILFFAVLIFIIFNIRSIKVFFYEWLRIIFNPYVIGVLLFAGLMFYLYLPTYLDASAVKTAIGTPEKTTRTGLTLAQLKFAAGETRLIFAFIAILILIFTKKVKSYSNAIITGWLISVFIMSWKPTWLFINIPSNRLANYLSFPAAVLGAFAFIWILEKIKRSQINQQFALIIYFLFFASIITGGFYDNSQSLNAESNAQKAIQTFRASQYLVNKTDENDLILKDHNYLVADSWIKLFFMRDYNFPLSRGYFKRYEDEFNKREMCTLWMISTPNLKQGRKCYDNLDVDFVMINPLFDSAQFEKSEEFNKVYISDEVGIYHKK